MDLNKVPKGGGFLIWDENDKPKKVTLEEHPVYTSEQDAIDEGYNKCEKCQAMGDDVHSCWNCDVELCVDCDENDMPFGADDHTYCTPCVNKLFTDADYESEVEKETQDEMEIRFCCGRDWRECPCENESEVE